MYIVCKGINYISKLVLIVDGTGVLLYLGTSLACKATSKMPRNHKYNNLCVYNDKKLTDLETIVLLKCRQRNSQESAIVMRYSVSINISMT